MLKKTGRFINRHGYYGVHKYYSEWLAIIKIDGCKKRLGSYPTKEEAAKAYDDASEANYGDRPNKT